MLSHFGVYMGAPTECFKLVNELERQALELVCILYLFGDDVQLLVH